MKIMRLLFLFLLFCSVIYSQNPSVKYFRGPLEVNAIAADNNYLWTGTPAGLIRTDLKTGTQQLYQQNTGTILNNTFFCMAHDPEGRLWIGQNGGVSVFDGSSWNSFKFNNTYQVRSIAFDKKGIAWFGTSRALIKYDGSAFTEIRPYNPGNTVYEVYSIAVDGKNTKWLGTSRGLEKYDDINGWITVDTLKSQYSLPPLSPVYSLAIDSKGSVWYSYRDSGLYKFDGQKRSPIPNTNPRISSYTPFMTFDSEGSLWMNANGLVKYDGTSWTLYDQTKTGKLGYMNCMACDSKGTIWIGTSANCASFNNGEFSVIELSKPVIGNSEIKDIVMDKDGLVWIITGSSLVCFDGIRLKEFNKGNSGLPSYDIYSVAFDKNNTKWIGTSAGLVKLEGHTWTVYNSLNSGLKYDAIKAITFDSKGVMWLGSGEGISRWDGTDWKTYNRFNSDFKGIAMSIAADKNDVIWIGTTTSGIFRFDGTKWEQFSYKDYGLPGSGVNKIYVDISNTKWFSAAGIVKYDDKSWYRYSLYNTVLANEFIGSFTMAGKDSFLLASSKGLYGYNTRTLMLSLHPMNSYLTEASIENVLIDSKGNIWAGSWNSGLTVFYKDDPNPLSERKLLQQNFPNPFNSTTQIEYYVPEAGNVQIKLYDIMGREVMMLLDEQKTPGSYSLRMNGSRLPSGVYIYTIRSGSFTDSQKLLLVK